MNLEFIIIAIFAMVFMAFFANKIIEIHAEKQLFDYKIAKRKILKPSKSKKEDIEEDSDYDDFVESLPPWLEGILEGANINMEKFYNGDENEMGKLKTLIEKLPDNSKTVGSLMD